MIVVPENFMTAIKAAPFGGRLSPAQANGVGRIIAAWNTLEPRNDDDRHLAYVLATAFHETGRMMRAVREGFAPTDESARKIVAHRPYGKPDPETGHVYYGRGLVQITWRANYERMGRKLGLDLVQRPDLALDETVSAGIIVRGMVDGSFTGKKLSTYFSTSQDDPVEARRIINGTDKAELIAGYHRAFLAALE